MLKKFVLVFCVFFCFNALSQEKYRVGVIVALTGDVGAFGIAVKNGIDMAYASLPKEQQDKLEIFFEDDQFKPMQSVSAFNKLISQKKINAIIAFGSGSAKAIASIAEQKKIPLLAIASDKAISHGRKYCFNFAVTPDEESKVAVPEAIRKGYKRVAIISTQHDGMLSMRDSFLEASQDKLEVTMDEEFQSSEKDFKTFLTKLKSNKNTDAILALLLPGQAGLFAKQTRELGIDLPIFGYESLDDEKEVKLSAGGLLGAWFVTSAEKRPEFMAQYSKKYPGASNYAADYAYDLVTLFLKASEPDHSGDTVAAYFSTLKDFHGMSGVISSSGDNRFSLPAGFRVITKEGIKPYAG